MMKNYASFFQCCLLIVALCMPTMVKAAAWEQIQSQAATQNVFVAPNGNLISSDFIFEYTGGIYYSQDNGATWTKADVEDHAYTCMIQAGDYIIASGEGCYMARSNDNGVTWEVLNYAYMFTDFIGEEGAIYDVAYAIAYFKDKIFVADYEGGGVIYSTDFGETWTLTDRESLKYDLGVSKSVAKGDGKALDSYYNLSVNNDELLLSGVYFVYRLNESDYTWELLRSDSNFLGVSATVGSKLIYGRAVMNYSDAVPFLEYTEDGGRTWGELPRPEGVIDNNVRAMYSDEKGLYVGLPETGMLYTPDLGQTWMDISEGLPHSVSTPPLMMASDDEYLYVALYDMPWSENKISGVYRYKKSELPVAAVNKTFNDEVKVYVSNNTLFATQAGNIAIYDIDGTLVLTADNCNTLDVAALNAGVYIYRVVVDGNQVTGKFVK